MSDRLADDRQAGRTPPGPGTRPGMRQGPRPLALHLTAALGSLLSSSAALPLLRNGLLPWSPALRDRAAALRDEMSQADRMTQGRPHRDGGAGDADRLTGEVDREIRRRIDAVLTGIERYRHHPYRRDLPDPPVVWTEGGSRLLDYGEKAGGRPVLFVPSLVNRGYILDLSRDKSLMRWLAARGFRPLLLDWGRPGLLERRFTLTDYIAGRLERALGFVVEAVGAPVPVAGYCMGGLLTAALAQRRPRDVAGLVLMATPWDFHAEDAATARRVATFIQPWGPVLDRWGELPTDALQALFAQLDPLLALKKFTSFARMAPDSRAAAAFVALEDWLNDGVPLVAGVARDALAGWYGRNDTMAGTWMVAGLPVDPGAIRMPTLALIPERDRIVPPASALALGAAIPGARILRPPLGHIGMVVSAGAETGVWNPLAEWLAATG
ncbi:poly-beta-hydroxybutyrate polymerase [Azospirillum sp. TSH7]|uniref:alpha/beta fold hydrolase n=1 Tax=unclassified Azospirillum TaxID=2630922 RepID=UPI000D605CEC|nr:MULTISPECIES: alpha/beta fold hydrolase [unclassified Azospirillum]PWC66008.1 poly-beta-hydroxybutyrate polymerase [Azospirillum sp. TSH20]PWC66976.1 poly-beta-hydroxybutyrate polymerase [Azospirillum sp. TSH7]